MGKKINFELPKNVRFSEKLGFDIVFQEVKVRGSKEVSYQVCVFEQGLNEFNVQDVYEFESWESMKKKYPEMKDFLIDLQNNVKWNAKWRYNDAEAKCNDRIYYIKSILGAEGLYDLKETVWLDAMDLNQIEEKNQDPKKKKGMKKSKP